MKSVSVSVCVVVHNASRYVRECIESILQQTFGDFELLIVDESSADDSCDIIRSYCDPRIRLIEHTNSRADSLNLLFDLAKGKYIACMEVGDVMLPYRLESQFKYMEQNPSVDVLGGLAEKIPNLYKCTARDFTKENREGVIGKNGELMWNKKYKKRMDIVYGNATCRNCSIFPICGGYCSQAKLEHMGDGCIMRYTNDDRERIVAERVKLLLGTI